tara:strand:- start:1752 stop:2663 length:912 start_codon:yes stop_codon:yes gene_type:complete
MISIIGAGNVGSTAALQIISNDLDDVTLIDVIEGKAEGEAMDFSQMACEMDIDREIIGTNDFTKLKGSDIIVVPAGMGRKPGETRMDLLHKNMGIVQSVGENIKKYAPDAIVIMVTNPLDAMTYVMYKTLGINRERVFGMSGALDNLRFKNVLANKLGVSRRSLTTLVIGEHGEGMLPLIKYSTVNGIPLNEFTTKEILEECYKETIGAAAKIIGLKGATFYAPSMAIYRMLEAIKLDKNIIMPASAFLQGEYNQEGLCIGVPTILGKNGIKKILELKLNENELKQFNVGVQNLKNAVKETKL